MARRRRRLAARVGDCARSLLAFLFSNVGVIVLVVAYAIAGAFMFQAIEGAGEMERENLMARKRDNTTLYLWQNVTLRLNPLNETALKDSISLVLRFYQREIVKAVRRGWDGGRSSRQWSFSSAFLYSLTVITTIGYGHLSPRTSWGKVTTIFYALLGMPLFLLYLANIGELLARWFKCLYALVCLCRGCPGFTRRRVARLRTQLEISDPESIERPEGWRSRHSDSDVTPDHRSPRHTHSTEHRQNHRDVADRIIPNYRYPMDYRSMDIHCPNYRGPPNNTYPSDRYYVDRYGANRYSQDRHILDRFPLDRYKMFDGHNVNYTLDHQVLNRHTLDRHTLDRHTLDNRHLDKHKLDRQPVANRSFNRQRLDRHQLDSYPLDRYKLDRRPLDRHTFDRHTLDRYPPRHPLNIPPVNRQHQDRHLRDRHQVDSYPLNRHTFDKHTLDRYPSRRPLSLSPVNRYQQDRYVVNRHPVDRYPLDRHTLDNYQLDRYKVERLPRHRNLPQRCEPDLLYSPQPNRDFQRRPDYFRSTSMPQPWASPHRADPHLRGWSEPLGYRTEESQGSSEFSYVTFDAQTITVPLSVCVFILVGYLLFGSMLFGMWEKWDQLDGAYFCFISLSSIGFGDFVPGERVYTPRIQTSFIVCSMYLMLGMALVAMCFNLMQEQVIHYVAGMKRAVKRICRCKR